MVTPRSAEDARMTAGKPVRVDRIEGEITARKLRDLSLDAARKSNRPASGNWFIAVSPEQGEQAWMLPSFVPAGRYGAGSKVRADRELGAFELFRFVVED